ncbi:hypothetical protein [Edaphobacter sp.]|uniref:hypothetical protein n=1 Tax=Edaphobacter sp. TaxID=1934404 RepID=UPI002DB93E26|nr:hypothetical protein [Edaphobacter sp.]HEU5341274.1 hypothetical protein [Edaphobacter sp.]
MSETAAFAQNWRAEKLRQPPLIAPARQFTYPRQIAGEEDALARGALQLLVQPASGGTFLATCALGFTDPRMPSDVYACPDPQELCAVAGGYAYIIDTAQPERSTHIDQKPVVDVRALPAQGLLLFTGFHSITAWGEHGLAWQSARLSWEGVRITGVENNALLGFGWNMLTDKEVAFTLDLQTGRHEGGGYTPPSQRR